MWKNLAKYFMRGYVQSGVHRVYLAAKGTFKGDILFNSTLSPGPSGAMRAFSNLV